MAGQGGNIALGLAQGILNGMQLRRQMDRDEEDRQARQEDREYLKSERARVASDRLALQNAAKPASVSQAQDLPNDDEGNPMPAMPQYRVETSNGVQRFDTQQQADAAAAKYNDPVASSQRISLALAQQGRPDAAMAYQEKADEYANKRWQRQVGSAIQGGFQGLSDLVNNSETGPFQGKKLKPVTSPDGKTVSFNVVGDDGSETPTSLQFTNDQRGVIHAAYMLDQSVTPEVRYKHMIETDTKAAQQKQKENELALRERELTDVKIPTAEARAELARVRGELADLRAQRGDGAVSREERLRYTTLFTDAGRRMQDASKRLNTMRSDRTFMKRAQVAGSPEAQQLQDVQQELTDHRQTWDTYRRLLGPQANASADAGDDQGSDTPPSAPTTGTKVPKGVQAARDADRAQILADELAKTQARLKASTDPGEQRRLQGDVDALQREIGQGSKKASLASASRQNPATSKPAAGPVKVATKAERDKLAPGTRYIGPDGQTYIKQ